MRTRCAGRTTSEARCEAPKTEESDGPSFSPQTHPTMAGQKVVSLLVKVDLNCEMSMALPAALLAARTSVKDEAACTKWKAKGRE